MFLIWFQNIWNSIEQGNNEWNCLCAFICMRGAMRQVKILLFMIIVCHTGWILQLRTFRIVINISRKNNEFAGRKKASSTIQFTSNASYQLSINLHIFRIISSHLYAIKHMHSCWASATLNCSNRMIWIS